MTGRSVDDVRVDISPDPEGEIILRPEDVERYHADKCGFLAERLGLPRKRYVLWRRQQPPDENGETRCLASTSSGTRCQGRVRYQEDPRNFAAELQVCKRHFTG